jgi:hypothetical protein
MAQKPTKNLPGTVRKVIKPLHPSLPEKAEISIDGADDLYKEIRIENTLVDEKGKEVALKPGVEVEVTVEADKDDTVAKKPDEHDQQPKKKGLKKKAEA